LSSRWWACCWPKHVERTISFAINIQSVASSWPFMFHVLTESDIYPAYNERNIGLSVKFCWLLETSIS
jgi:hypothetical protein